LTDALHINFHYLCGMYDPLDQDEEKLPLLIVGTGPEARMALDIANHLDVLVFGFLSDDEAEYLLDLNDIAVVAVLDSTDAELLLKDKKIQVGLAEKDIDKRKKLVKKVRKHHEFLSNLVSPGAIVSPYATIGAGNLLCEQVYVGPNARIGSHNYFAPLAGVEPDVEIGDFCTFSSGVRIGTGATIHDEVFIGMGAMIHPKVNIGKGAMIGPGSVVLRDVPAKATVHGNPAREV
jgi:sugar O-acyltransferase (sialic acid O-acetyltransferase NeuD family)